MTKCWLFAGSQDHRKESFILNFQKVPHAPGALHMTHENSSRLSQIARDFTDLLATDYTDYTEFNQ